MFTMSEMIVLLWLAPVAINIILPLIVLGFWLIRKLFTLSVRTEVVREKVAEQETERRQVFSTAGN